MRACVGGCMRMHACVFVPVDMGVIYRCAARACVCLCDAS